MPQDYINLHAAARIAELAEALHRAHAAVAAGGYWDGPVQGPSPVLCKCGAPFWEHAGGPRLVKGRWVDGQHKGQHGGKHHAGAHVTPNGCAKYAEDVVDRRVWEALEGRYTEPLTAAKRQQRANRRKGYVERPLGKWGIAPSDATSCPRAVWYRETIRAGNVPEGYVRADSWDGEATMGTLFHDALMRLLVQVYPWREYEFRVVLPGLDTENSRGDEYDPLLAVVRDYKSAGDAKWNMLAADGPDEETWDQVYIYALCKDRLGEPVREISLTYTHRDHGNTETFYRPYDRARAEAALQRLIDMAMALDLGQVLPRHPDRTGPSNDPLCGRCPHRLHCWNIPAARRAGRSPESFTILGAEPEDPTIAEAGRMFIEATVKAGAAKKHRTYVQSLLDGIQPGTYGGDVVVKRARSGTDPWRRLRWLEAHWGEPDASLDDAPDTTAQSSKMTAEPVRAANRQRKAAESLPPTPKEEQPMPEHEGATTP